MRIYYFDDVTGVFQGEGYADEAAWQRGVFTIPPHATTIAPPDCKSGEAPFYDGIMRKWEIRDLPRRANAEPDCKPGLADRYPGEEQELLYPQPEK